MVVRGWGGSVATAVGVAAAVGAAQLGLGYGMEIISWRPGVAGLSTEAWLASLAWATWIAATSTVAGAVVAERLARPPQSTPADAGGQPDRAEPAPEPEPEPDRLTRTLWRLVLAVAAALGATTTVALTAVPARMAEPVGTSSPHTVAAGYAVVGVLVGLVIAAAALTARAVTANLIVTAGWLWLLAVVAVVDGVLAGRDWERVPLGFWEFTVAEPWLWPAGNIFLPDAGLAIGAALVLGFLAALPAARRGDSQVGLVVSGGAGPLVLAAAYLLAQPNLVGAEAIDLSRHLVVPYVVLAGLLGSLLSSAVRPRSPRRQPDPDPEPAPHQPEVAGEPAEEPEPAEEEPAVPSQRASRKRSRTSREPEAATPAPTGAT